MSAESLLKKYKETLPTGHLADSKLVGHPLYWILMRMIHLGAYERLSAIIAWTGLNGETIDILFNVAATENPEFPLSIGLHSKLKEKIVQIDPNALDNFRKAAYKVSPEHMPHQTIKLFADNNTETANPELLFQAFRSADEDYVQKTIAVFRATDGLDNIREIHDEDGITRHFAVQTPQAQLIITPVVGVVEHGYYANRHDVLDARATAQEGVNTLYAMEKTKPIVISTGFSDSAQKVCLFEPKVLLMALWAFLKLMGYLQVVGKKSVGPRAFSHIDKLLYEQGPGQFHDDGFVIKTINEFLKPNYPI